MIEVSVAEAKAHLSEYLNRVEAGETIVLTRRNRPIAELRSIPAPIRARRPAGLCEGEFTVPDDFDDSLPDDVLAGFEGR